MPKNFGERQDQHVGHGAQTHNITTSTAFPSQNWVWLAMCHDLTNQITPTTNLVRYYDVQNGHKPNPLLLSIMTHHAKNTKFQHVF